jgi:hypothetical protein
MNITPEMVAVIVNIMVLVGGFLKLESRLTKLETTQKLMVDGLIQTKQLDRRQEG